MPAASRSRAAVHSMIWMQGGGTLARNTGPRQWAKPALIQRWRHKGLMGELAGMARYPLTGQGFELLGCGFGVFVLAAIALYPACLLTHSRTEQGMFIGKRDADTVAVFHLAAPCHIARITGAGAQGWDVQINRRALAPGTRPMAGDTAQTGSEQALAGNGGRGTLD